MGNIGWKFNGGIDVYCLLILCVGCLLLVVVVVVVVVENLFC